jgi:hypothetical protein
LNEERKKERKKEKNFWKDREILQFQKIEVKKGFLNFFPIKGGKYY